jgi:Membrane-bound serine protease (ClpP class)
MLFFIAFLLCISIAALMLAHKSRRHKRLALPVSLLSSQAIVDAPLHPTGSVLINGELWLARSANDTRLESRTKVIVVGVQDHVLLVAER